VVGIRIVEDVEVLEDCRGDSIEPMAVVRLVKVDVAIGVTVTVAEGTVMTVARLVTDEVAAVIVTTIPTMGNPFIEQ
jgi:hypothetical protein